MATPCPPHEFWGSVDRCVKCGMPGEAYAASRAAAVSAPPVASDETKEFDGTGSERIYPNFIPSLYRALGDATKGEEVIRCVKGGEAALLTDLASDFWEWGHRTIGRSGFGYLGRTLAWSILDVWIPMWLTDREQGRWTRSIPSAAKPSNPMPNPGHLRAADALPCGCSASGVALFGHYSNCAESVKALQAIVDEKPKDDGKVDWISVTPRSPDTETIQKARAMESALNSLAFREWHKDPANCGESPGDGGNRFCRGAIRWNADPWPNVKRNPRFRGRTCAEVYLSELTAFNVGFGKVLARDINRNDPGQIVEVTPQGVQTRPAPRKVVVRRRAAEGQAAHDAGVNLVSRRVTGCARCRIRRFTTYCPGCGDRVTSFDLRDGESGW